MGLKDANKGPSVVVPVIEQLHEQSFVLDVPGRNPLLAGPLARMIVTNGQWFVVAKATVFAFSSTADTVELNLAASEAEHAVVTDSSTVTLAGYSYGNLVLTLLQDVTTTSKMIVSASVSGVSGSVIQLVSLKISGVRIR